MNGHVSDRLSIRVDDRRRTVAVAAVPRIAAAAAEMQSSSESMSAIADQTKSQAMSAASGSEEASANVQTVATAAEEIDPATLTADAKRHPEGRAANVIGILEGSDPELKDEFVVFSGHMDHVGVGNPDASGDSIFNGADDDASGTIAVVEVAEAMASLETAPRRSMIFLLVSGEEKGLWGSRYFAENPSVPVSQMVANMNMDMVGRNWPDTIVAIGKEHSDLGVTLNTVNERHPELNMTAIDDRWPEERFYFRSDHYNFARKGVPVLFFFNGTHEDYHRPSDDVEKINVEASRNRCGAALARRDDVEVDLVAGVPDSGTAHAIGYANEARVPYGRPFVKYTPTWPRSGWPPPCAISSTRPPRLPAYRTTIRRG